VKQEIFGAENTKNINTEREEKGPRTQRLLLEF
jgi:hypothetical protein